MTGLSPGIVQVAAAAIFAVAVLHTFSTRYLQHLAHVNPSHAGLWHLLGEVEVVFGFWAMVLLLFLGLLDRGHDTICGVVNVDGPFGEILDEGGLPGNDERLGEHQAIVRTPEE